MAFGLQKSSLPITHRRQKVSIAQTSDCRLWGCVFINSSLTSLIKHHNTTGDSWVATWFESNCHHPFIHMIQKISTLHPSTLNLTKWNICRNSQRVCKCKFRLGKLPGWTFRFGWGKHKVLPGTFSSLSPGNSLTHGSFLANVFQAPGYTATFKQPHPPRSFCLPFSSLVAWADPASWDIG